MVQGHSPTNRQTFLPSGTLKYLISPECDHHFSIKPQTLVAAVSDRPSYIFYAINRATIFSLRDCKLLNTACAMNGVVSSKMYTKLRKKFSKNLSRITREIFKHFCILPYFRKRLSFSGGKYF